MNPFIPKSHSKVAIVDYRADKQIIKRIKTYGLNIIKTIKCNDILEPVNGHPDMVLHPIDYETVIAAPNVFEYYKEALDYYGIKVIKGGKTLCRNYPEDIAYNVARIGDYAIHNLSFTDEILRYYLQKSGVKLVHVNQGYSKCSTACINETSSVTSDITIYSTIKKLGFESVFINPENIILEGFNYGFIGGSIGLINHNTIMAAGSLEKLPDGDKLKQYIIATGLKLDIACDKPLTDVGTIIVL